MSRQRHVIGKHHDEAHTALRRQFYTASVIGAVLGVHQYMSRLKLYMIKRGIEFPDDPDNPVFKRGRWFEPAVGVAVAEHRPEWTIEKCNEFYCDTETLKGASPDFLIHGDPRGPGVLQAKTVAPSVYERDWRNGKAVPDWIVFQALTEAELTDAAFAAIAVLKVDAFNPICEIIEFDRHPAAEQRLTEEVARFHRDVENGIEPDPDFARDAELLKILSPRHAPGKTLDLSGNNEVPILLAQREQLCAEILEREAKCEVIETELKFLMDDAETISGLPDWHVTFKSGERKEYVVPAKTLRPLRIYDRRPEPDRPR